MKISDDDGDRDVSTPRAGWVRLYKGDESLNIFVVYVSNERFLIRNETWRVCGNKREKHVAFRVTKVHREGGRAKDKCELASVFREQRTDARGLRLRESYGVSEEERAE